MSRLAFYTFAILKEPWGHPVAQGIIDAVADVFREAESTQGFIARALQAETGGAPSLVVACHRTECQRRTGPVFEVAAELSERP